ncbi:DcaP family trimeric outer membrane transporter [Sphingomonas sp. HDW15A]|uniref:DcaP family trimeric outer membrane transporter n=1 Tax=Sphingomonas sp. HDW15A TaxID=2714942 RepID=UPI0019D215BA|nr:DcaP family trimeric outer membrane transporter [Sphingomonas sp. HDW15A]
MTYVKLAAGLGVLLATPAFAAADNVSGQPTAQQGSSAAERDALLKEIEALRARVEALEAKEAAAPPPTPAAAPATESRAEKLAKDHNLELYGFVQLDAIQDFNRVDPDWEASLRASKIPTEEGAFGSDGQSIFSVRQTRLGVKASGTLHDKPYEAKFEFDLFGTGDEAGQTHMRIRHMYAKWGPILAGQTNTLFMDVDIAPNSIEYWGPPGMAWLRNPQLRWTFLDRNGWQAAIAIEHPADDIDPGNLRLIDESIADNIQSDEELPDLTAALGYYGNWGHVRLAGLLRKIGYDTRLSDGNEPEGSQTGWGVDLTGSFKLGLATPKLGVVYGRGIATYMNDGGMDLAPSVEVTVGPGGFIIDPEAEAVKLLGVSAFVDFQWAKKWSSTIGYSFTKVWNTNFQDASAFHKGEYALANLLWYPADPVMAGLELQWGQRTDNDGDKGDDLRLQASFKWSFTSNNIWSWFE